MFVSTQPPTRADAFVYRCFALNAMNEKERALRDCDEAIGLNSNLLRPHRSEAREAKGETNRALSDYNSAILLAHDNVPALKNRRTSGRSDGIERGATHLSVETPTRLGAHRS